MWKWNSIYVKNQTNSSLLHSPIIWGWQVYRLFFRWPACKIHRRTSHGSRRFWFGFGFIYCTSKSFRENRRLFCFAYEESKRMGLEEAGVNQATVWSESGADRTASSRENPVPSTAPWRMFLQHLAVKEHSSFFNLLNRDITGGVVHNYAFSCMDFHRCVLDVDYRKQLLNELAHN